MSFTEYARPGKIRSLEAIVCRGFKPLLGEKYGIIHRAGGRMDGEISPKSQQNSIPHVNTSSAPLYDLDGCVSRLTVKVSWRADGRIADAQYLGKR